MSWLDLAESEAETLLKELKAHAEYLFSGFGANAHAHLDPIIDTLQAHVDSKAPVQAADPVAEVAPVVEAEPVVAAEPVPAEPAPVAQAEQTAVTTEQV